MVAAQETMLVFLRPLSAPGEKLSHNWCTYEELWAGVLSSRDLEEELYHYSLKPPALGLLSLLLWELAVAAPRRNSSQRPFPEKGLADCLGHVSSE